MSTTRISARRWKSIFGVWYKPVGGADGDGEAVDAGQFNKTFCLLRIGQKSAFSINAHVIFHAAQASEFCFDAAITGMAKSTTDFTSRTFSANGNGCHRSRCDAGVHFTGNIFQRFVMIEMQRQRHVVGGGVSAAQRVDLSSAMCLNVPGVPARITGDRISLQTSRIAWIVSALWMLNAGTA
jgi:hypothetical protein